MIAVAFALLMASQDASLDEAKARFNEGKEAYDLGHFDDALAAFEAAYKAKPLPGFLFNLGQCHFGLGHYRRAVFFYERYLELMPAAPNRELVEQLIAEAKAKEIEVGAAAAPPPTTTAAPPTPTPTPPPATTTTPTPATTTTDAGPPWGLIAGATAGAIAVVVVSTAAVVLMTQGQPPVSTLGTLDRSRP